jgi:orotidine-5'-phosphate decarboxylase
MEPFGERLHALMRLHGPLCAGIDPHPGLLDAWGLPQSAEGVARFSGIVVEALAGRVAVLKPQSAFFESYGSKGVAVLERIIADVRGTSTLVLVDAKRGDIGSTVDAYAAAYLDPSSPLAGDALTASPYLGFGSLQPLVDSALTYGRGLFVLGMTSNPEGAEVQSAVGADGRTVAATVLDHLAHLNAGVSPLGSFGAVVGATVGSVTYDLSALNGPLLAPGFGAQGGTPDDLRRVFGPALPQVLPSTSRELLRHGPDLQALRDAAARTADQLAALTR